jgi:hypothetical protein
MRCFRLVCTLWLSALAMPCAAQAPTPAPAKPALIINDLFAAPLWRIDVDADETHLVAGSPAKAAAVWSLDDPSAAELLRLPLRDEEMQRAHAIAISPDGKRVAAAVPPLRDDKGFARAGTAAIYIIERASRRIEKAITSDVATRPQALRFSPDGTLLAATLSDGCGLRVWRAAGWSLAGSDDAGYGGPSGTCCPATAGTDCDPFPDTPGLAWSKSASGEQLLITSGDTGVRLYKPDANSVALLATKSPADIALERPEGVAVSPDGARLAVGDARVRGASQTVKLQVAVLDLMTLTPTSANLTLPEAAVLSPALLDAKATPGADQMALNRVAWTEDDSGEAIYAGGLTWCQIADPSLVLGTQEGEGTENCIVRWRLPASGSADKPGDVHFIRAGLDRVMDLAALPKRKALAYATLQRIGALHDDGTTYVNDAGTEVFAAARAFDFRDRPVDRKTGAMLGFDVSADASTVYFEDYRGTAAAPIALTFNIDQLKLEQATARPANVAPPKRDPLIVDKLANWWNGAKPPVIYGLPLDALQGIRDTYRAVALAPDKRAVVGSATHVRVVGYGSGKAEVLCQLRVSAEAYRAAVSDDGSLTVVGHSDGTLRWYRIEHGKDGAACSLTQLLAVHIRQADGEDGSWIWASWLPTTGQFAADPRAKDLLGWQVSGAGGQVETVRFADLLQYYAPDAVKAALRQSAPSPDVVASLEKSIGDATDALRLMVLTPDENSQVATETVKFDIKADGGTTWPRKLYVATGSGARIAKTVLGKDIAPNDAIEIAAPGIVQMQVKLPPSERQQHRNVDVCFLVDRQRDCHTINWSGALEKPAARALHAVIVGVSAYKDPAMSLAFAQNDALDLARIFVNDYKARIVDKTSRVPADYASVSIDLLVAAGSSSAKSELADLQSSGIVRVHDAAVGNIAAVLGKLAQQGTNENDLVLFYFSGHGMLNPFRGAKGLTALLGPNIDGNYTRESLEREALTSDRLIALLDPIPGEKLVIIDACRTTATIAGESAFDPAAIRLEFERNLLSADFFFSAAPGQYSLDQGELAYSTTRPKDEQGNGLFTYALLKSLTDMGTAPAGSKPRKVEVYDVDRYVRGFFDSQDEESAAVRLIRRLQEQGISVALQQPMYVPARRRVSAGTVIRTLEPAQ